MSDERNEYWARWWAARQAVNAGIDATFVDYVRTADGTSEIVENPLDITR